MEQTLHASLRDQLGEALINTGAVPHTMPIEVFGQAGVLADAVLPIARHAAETAAQAAIEQAAALFEARGRALLDGGLTDCAEVATLLRQFAALPPDTAAAVTQHGALPVPVPVGPDTAEGDAQPVPSAAELQHLRDKIAGLQTIVGAATEFRVWNADGMGLYVRRAIGADGFAVLEGRIRAVRGRRAWTPDGWRFTALLSEAEVYCWPDASAALAEAQRLANDNAQSEATQEDVDAEAGEG